jgi:UPF0042 nucleotide-binding protein
VNAQLPPAGARPRARLILVTGLSGAGKSSVLHGLEDLGFEVVDNPPLAMVPLLARAANGRLAIGLHARSEVFEAGDVLDVIGRLREDGMRPELVFASADEEALLRRYTETRRRHPLAPSGQVIEGIRLERQLTEKLRSAADLVLDTTTLAPAALRGLVERKFSDAGAAAEQPGLSVTLMSFAFPAGLPREADLVFDARFLRNPHYDPILRPRTGLDPSVGAYVEADPDFEAFLGNIRSMLTLLLPRFVQEGKKYATIAIGCTGGRHRSVHLVEKLARSLPAEGWRLHVTHRELAREPGLATEAAERRTVFGDVPAVDQRGGGATHHAQQAQEAWRHS